MKKWIVILLVLALAVVGCEYFMGPEGPEGPEGPPGEIEYWEHTISNSETSWVSSIGTYAVVIQDDRFEIGAWYDFYQVYDEDNWIPMGIWFDAVAMIWYNEIMISDGGVVWFSLGDWAGETIVIFKAPAELATKALDAREFFSEWPPGR